MQLICLPPTLLRSLHLAGLLLLIGLPSALAQAQAQQRTTFWRKLHPDSLTSRPLRFVPLPVLQSGPEIGVKGGITLDYFYNAGTGQPDKPRFRSRYWQRLDSLNRRTRDSYAFVHALYSTRRQLAVEGVWNTYGAAERYVMRGRGGYIDYSEDYWGVGNQTLNEPDYSILSYQRWYVQHRFWRRIKGSFFTGLAYYYSDTQDLQLTKKNQLLDESLPGSQGSVVSGLGPTVLADYRNNPFTPTRGWYAEWAFQLYSHKLGSQFDYTEQSVDVRRYLPLSVRSLIGLQLIGQFTTGTVPLRELPRLGGPNMLRGFVQGRYRDRQLWAAQVEYRHTLNRFLVAAAFAALGGVAEHVTDFSPANTRYAGGVGMRVLLNRKKQVYLRTDFAVNSNGTANLYLRMLEAF